MNRRAGLLVAVLLGAGVLPAQTPPPAPPASRPMLWRIDRPRPAFVLGTIHMADKRVAVLPAPVVTAVEQSDAVYTEIGFSEADVNTAFRHQLLPPGEKLLDKLPEAVATTLQDFLRRKGQAVSSVQRLKPWAAWMRVTSVESARHAVGPRIMDLELLQLARDEDKRTDCLETIDEQMGLFDQIPGPEQVALLQSAMAMVDRMHRAGEFVVEHQLATYLRGDEQENLRWFREHLGPPPEHKELIDAMTRRMLTERNERMAARMGKALRERPNEAILFAVGAYHLGGERGVLALLRQQGQRLERIEAVPPASRPVRSADEPFHR